MIETRPYFDEEDVHHYFDSHLPPYLPVPDPRARDYYSPPTGIHHGRLEFGFCVGERTVRIDQAIEAKQSIHGNGLARSAGID